MPDLIDIINEISRKVAEDYILMNKDMNESIYNYADENDLNLDTVKRICEKANQNVYLSKFNNESVNRKNIEFDMADYNTIASQLKESETAMQDYDTVPVDFKSGLNLSIDDTTGVSEVFDDSGIKLASYDIVIDRSNKLKSLRDSLETLKVAELNSAKDSFSSIFHDTKVMVSNGESIADMAKLAMRYVKGKNLDMMKIAKVYDLISEEMKDSGFSVNEEITKTSSLAINEKSEMYKPVYNYVMSLEKVAGLNDMIKNIDESISIYNEAISEEIQNVK